MVNIFEPEIKDKNCKHDWIKLHSKGKRSSLMSTMEVEFDYLFCPKCDSTNGDSINC